MDKTKADRIALTRTLAGIALLTIECATSESRTAYRGMGVTPCPTVDGSPVGVPYARGWARGEVVRGDVEQSLMM